MALSDREQQLLDQMERALASEDPRLAHVFGGHGRPLPTPSRNLGAAVLGMLVGAAALIGGVALSQPAIGIVGFLVVVGALSAVLTGSTDAAAPAKAPKAPVRRDFMRGLEERWDRRGDDQ